MLRKFTYILLIIIACISFVGCSASSRTSVEPWPGLYQLKETNKNGYKSKKERKKELKKMRKRRSKSRN